MSRQTRGYDLKERERERNFMSSSLKSFDLCLEHSIAFKLVISEYILTRTTNIMKYKP